MLVIAALLVAGLADAGRVPRLPLNGDLLWYEVSHTCRAD